VEGEKKIRAPAGSCQRKRRVRRKIRRKLSRGSERMEMDGLVIDYPEAAWLDFTCSVAA